MSTFIMLGTYSSESMKGISAERTKEAQGIFKKVGGEAVSVYALLGGYDLAIVANFPGIEEAMKASVALSRMTGVSFSTFPAIPADRFDELTAEM